MTKHTDITTATKNAKSAAVKIGSPSLSGAQVSAKAIDTATVPATRPAPSTHLTDLIAAYTAATQEHDAHFYADGPDVQALCNAAIDKIEKAMEAICAYHPAPNDRDAWGEFLRQQLKDGYWVSDSGRVEAMLDAMVRNVTSSPASVGFDSEATDLPEVQMGWLVRSFRDAAMQIDPTIRGFWISNTIDEDLGATSYHGITFNRGTSRNFEKLRADFLASGRLEQLDLSDVKLMDLIGLFHALDRYRTAVDSFLSADVFFTHDAKGKANGSTWNGHMIEALREWSEAENERVIEAIRAYEPETAYVAYQRSLFLVWWEAEIGGELHDVLSLAAEGAAGQAAFGEDAGNTPARVMAEFAQLDEAGQEQLLAAARNLAAQKQAA